MTTIEGPPTKTKPHYSNEEGIDYEEEKVNLDQRDTEPRKSSQEVRQPMVQLKAVPPPALTLALTPSGILSPS